MHRAYTAKAALLLNESASDPSMNELTGYTSQHVYRVIPGSRNWQVETADWIWPVSSSVL